MPTPPTALHHRLIVGYHACDRSVAERVLLSGEQLVKSRNRYDWLGEGVYFWEHGERRAWEFAQEQQARGKIETPAVLGAYIYLGRCFDLTDTWATEELAVFYRKLVVALVAAGHPHPANRPGRPRDHDLLLRDLDCAVLNLGLTRLDHDHGRGDVYFQTVRGVFVEGEPAYPGGRIHRKTHIQVSVRDPSCILGYFMPAPGLSSQEVNP